MTEVSVRLHTDKETIYLDPIVASVKWSGDIMQASRKLQVQLHNTLDGKKRAVNVQNGQLLTLVVDQKEVFRGGIFVNDIKANGQHSLSAYDDNIYLTKNKDTKIFRNLKASQIIQKVCAEFGIATGTIEDTGFIIPKLILRDKTLWDMFITALTVTRKHTGRRYYLSSKQGKLHLLSRKTQTTFWVLENGTNILDASYSQSIEETKTQVKVMTNETDEKKSPIIAKVKNDALIKKFGIMQHLESVDRDMKKSEIQQLAKQLLKDLGTIDDVATVDALGNVQVYAGTGVKVKESMTGIIGGYYVATDEHTFENGNHLMNVQLSATDELPSLDYEEPSS